MFFESDPEGTIKINREDYVYIKLVNHSLYGTGYFLKHRVVIAEELGRVLTDTEIVHHRNEFRFDNRRENLELTQAGPHSRYHNTGREWSEEAKAEMSKRRKGQKWSDEIREKIAAANRARAAPLSEETKEKIRQKQTGKKMSAESSEKKSKALKGKPKSEEHRRKISESLRNRK